MAQVRGGMGRGRMGFGAFRKQLCDRFIHIQVQQAEALAERLKAGVHDMRARGECVDEGLIYQAQGAVQRAQDEASKLAEEAAAIHEDSDDEEQSERTKGDGQSVICIM